MKFYFDKIERLRKKENLSCKKLSQIIKVGRTTLWKWETGKSVPSEGYIRLLAQALKVPVTEISNLEPEQPKSDINYSETINSWLSFIDIDFEIIQQKSINDALQKILTLNKEFVKASVVIRALLQGINTIIYIKDKDLKYMTANDSFLTNVSLNPSFKVLNKNDSDFFNANEAKKNHEEDKKVLLSGTPVLNIERFIPGSRKRKWGLVSKIPIFDSNKKISGIIGTFTDITKLKESEKRRKLLEEAINGLDTYIWIAKYSPKTDKDIKIIFLNNSMINKYLSFSKNKIDFTNDIERNIFICREFSPEHFMYTEDLIRNKPEKLPVNHEVEIQSKIYGGKRLFSEKILNYADNYYFGVLEDITEKKKTEQRLNFLGSSIDIINDGIVIFDLKKDNYVYLNRGTEKIFGYPIEEFYHKGRDFWLNKCVHPDDKENEKKYYLNKNWPKIRQYRVMKSNGEIKWIENRTHTRTTLMGDECIISILHDITDRVKGNELSLLLQKTLENSNDCMSLRRLEPYELIYLSRSFEKIFGYPREMFFKNKYFRLEKCVHPEDKEIESVYVKTRKYPKERYYRIIKPDGETANLHETTFKMEHNGHKYLCGIARDVTYSDNLKINKAIKDKISIVAKKLKEYNIDPQIISNSTGLNLLEINEI